MKRLGVSAVAGGLIVSLLLATGIGAIRTASAVKAAPAAGSNAEEDDRVEGSWYISIQVTEPSPATFDALYGFAKGGVFTRIDGRNNAPALGTWQRTEDGTIVSSFILFNFTTGVRTGYITGKFAARVVDGTLTGTFTAEGHGIPGFLPRSGTFTGTRIVVEAP
jgi:hypothetical protein